MVQYSVTLSEQNFQRFLRAVRLPYPEDRRLTYRYTDKGLYGITLTDSLYYFHRWNVVYREAVEYEAFRCKQCGGWHKFRYSQDYYQATGRLFELELWTPCSFLPDERVSELIACNVIDSEVLPILTSFGNKKAIEATEKRKAELELYENWKAWIRRREYAIDRWNFWSLKGTVWQHLTSDRTDPHKEAHRKVHDNR